MPHVLIELNVVQLMEPSTLISQVCLCGVLCYAKTTYFECNLTPYNYMLYSYIHSFTHTHHISHTVTHIY